MHQGLLVGQKILWNLINSLMESGFTQNLCFPQCYKSCFDLAAGEGAEINIKPWHILLGGLKEGTTRIPWLNREPYAYWKGNPAVAETRQDLIKCNVSENQDWNARLFAQDWFRESQEGFNKSDLPSQCTYRYKVYIEGSAWSVSQKYILSCDSTTLRVRLHVSSPEFIC
ncbi:hypothetical protein AAZV13_16G159900 [Glycine max]